jgi:hypothetical protein
MPLFYATDVFGHVARKAVSLFVAAGFGLSLSSCEGNVTIKAAIIIAPAGFSNGEIVFTS